MFSNIISTSKDKKWCPKREDFARLPDEDYATQSSLSIPSLSPEDLPEIKRCWHTAPSSADRKYSCLRDSQRPHSTGTLSAPSRLKSQSSVEKLDGLKLPPETETKVSKLFTRFKKAMNLSPYEPLPDIGCKKPDEVEVTKETTYTTELGDCDSTSVLEESAESTDSSEDHPRLIRSNTYTILDVLNADNEEFSPLTAQKADDYG